MGNEGERTIVRSVAMPTPPILVPKLHLGTHLSRQLYCLSYRHASHLSNGVTPGHHSCAEE
jgi:hypothetical protein